MREKDVRKTDDYLTPDVSLMTPRAASCLPLSHFLWCLPLGITVPLPFFCHIYGQTSLLVFAPSSPFLAFVSLIIAGKKTFVQQRDRNHGRSGEAWQPSVSSLQIGENWQSALQIKFEYISRVKMARRENELGTAFQIGFMAVHINIFCGLENRICPVPNIRGNATSVRKWTIRHFFSLSLTLQQLPFSNGVSFFFPLRYSIKSG